MDEEPIQIKYTATIVAECEGKKRTEQVQWTIYEPSTEDQARDSARRLIRMLGDVTKALAR